MPTRMSGNGSKAYWMTGSSRKAIPNVQEWSGDPPGGTGVLRGPPNCLGVVGRPYWMSRSGRETLPNVREW